jgi:hypothetical protein
LQLSVAAHGAAFRLESAVNEPLGRFEVRANTSLFTGDAFDAQLNVANSDSAIDTLSMLQIQARVVAARANPIGGISELNHHVTCDKYKRAFISDSTQQFIPDATD